MLFQAQIVGWIAIGKTCIMHPCNPPFQLDHQSFMSCRWKIERSELMKWRSVFWILCIACILECGCFRPIINFDPPSYEHIDSWDLPPNVFHAFTADHPKATIREVGSLYWPPMKRWHYRFLFVENGKQMQVEYRQGGIQIEGSLIELAP
jgi:hypothetical protein